MQLQLWTYKRKDIIIEILIVRHNKFPHLFVKLSYVNILLELFKTLLYKNIKFIIHFSNSKYFNIYLTREGSDKIYKTLLFIIIFANCPFANN